MYVGVDVGGTKIAVGLVDQDGQLLFQKSCPTRAERPAHEVIEDITVLIKKLVKESHKEMTDILGIGIGIPGMAEKDTGNVIECVNLGWKHVPLKRLMEKEFDKPVYIDNDASVAALAEYEIGSLKGADNSALITIGTGIGGGIIVNGKLHNGSHGIGCEIGHTIVGENFYDCSCGRNGCLETFASATALIRYTKKLIEETKEETIIIDKLEGNLDLLEAKTILDSAKEGDCVAVKAVDRFIKYLSIGLLNLINILDPEVIAIGGGVSKAGNYLLNLIEKNINNNKAFGDMEIAKITLARLGNEAGIVGAAMLCKHM